MSTATSTTSPSFRALVRLVLQSALPRPQKAVLQALLAYARPDLTVYHAQGQLAWACDYTRPVVKQALAALKAQAILRVRQGPRQHRATEYAIDLSRLPSRAPYDAQDAEARLTDRAPSPEQQEIQLPTGEVPLTGQRTIELPTEEIIPPTQQVTELPPASSGGSSVTLRGQIASPQVGQQEQEKKFFVCHETRPPDSSVVPAENPPDTSTPKCSELRISGCLLDNIAHVWLTLCENIVLAQLTLSENRLTLTKNSLKTSVSAHIY